MSAIDGIGASSVTQLLTQGSRRPDADDQNGTPEAFQKALATALQNSNVDASKIPDLQKQIQDAVQQARTSAQDPASVRQAIDSVLKQNGIDPTKFHAEMRKAMPRHGHRHAKTQPTTPTNPVVPAPTAQADASGAIDVQA